MTPEPEEISPLAFATRFSVTFLVAMALFAAGYFTHDSTESPAEITEMQVQEIAALSPQSGMVEGQESAADAESVEQCERGAPASAEAMLQDKLGEVQSTHLIRRYHDRFALLDLDALLEKQIDIGDMQQAGRDSHLSLMPATQEANSIYLNMPSFTWTRIDNARPVDAMRLTFRGNGIPKRLERLAGSDLVEPKLRAFYTAITQPSATLWKARETLAFTLKTFDGKIYRATSTPFIAIEKIAKQDYARMKSAALPYLWRVYADEEAEGPSLSSASPTTEELAKTQPAAGNEELSIIADSIMPGHGPGAMADFDAAKEMPSLLDEGDVDRMSVSALLSDTEQLESLFFAGVVEEAKSREEAELLKQAIVDRRRSSDFFQQDATRLYASRLAAQDPEFNALFLVNNLFEQYNIFSVFEKGVRMRVNAIDNRLNMVYTSYNLDFVPEAASIPEKILKSYGSDTQTVRVCNDDTIHVSDEFFLITASPHSYLIRVYLPRCGEDKMDYGEVDYFLSNIRLLDESTYNIKRWLQ